ncbi:MAG: Serine/threonine-protein kinase PknD [Planctomycetes bacterium]|nr:Serine/threonine-protein kinase PknD [Planctomycetota bacterium]HRJ76875.1 protein kinase [Planctomycetota bacterium]
MLDERQKKLAAAILAVREGRLNAADAVALVKDPGKKASDILAGSGAAQLSDPQRVMAALSEAGVSDEETRLIGNGDDRKLEQVVRKTLYNVAPTMPPSEGSTERPSTTRLRRPSRILDNQRYTIKREFARGGQGRIMIARDNVVGREVALKELLPELQETAESGTPATAGVDTIGVVERFLREAKVTGQLEHPNVVPVYEIGRRESGSLYYTMKFVRGQTMAERLRDIDRLSQLTRDKRLALRLKLLEAFQGICNAVAFAHSRGVIHRDLKPQNIMVGDFGETVLLDWGLARVKGQDDKIGRQLTLLATNMLSESLMRQNADGLTVDGTVFGTPHYMPPEQARADLKEIDEQSDVYSLGAILYEILTGAPPYDGPTAGAVLQQVMAGPPRKIREREPLAPPELAALCEFAMAHDKSRRMKTALQLAQEVQAYRDGGKLSVYRYGAYEQARRVIAKNRGAFLAGALSFWMLLGGALLFFVWIVDQKRSAEDLQGAAETDRDKTSRALANAQAARRAQEDLKNRLAEEASKRLAEREDEIRALQETLAGMRIEPLMRDIAGRVNQYEDIEAHGRALDLTPGERSSNNNLLMSMMGYVTAQESLISLISADGDEVPQAMDPRDIEQQRQRLAQSRLLAARLAAYNSDFAQAELLLAGTEASEATLKLAREWLDRTRAATLRFQRQAIIDALADAREGFDRTGRSITTSLPQYVERLSFFRSSQTISLLDEALRALAARVRQGERSFTAGDLDTVALACSLLAALQLPLETAGPLQGFLASQPPQGMAVLAARALCELKTAQAFGAVAALARGPDDGLWVRVQGAFAAMPMPSTLAGATGAEELALRALAQLARGKFAEAEQDCTEALKLDSSSPWLHLLRGRARASLGRIKEAMEDFSRAMTLDPVDARPCIDRAKLHAASGSFSQALTDFSQALSRDQQSISALLERGRARMAQFDYVGAQADFARAALLAPHRPDVLLALGRCRESLFKSAEADEDYTRAIAADPYDAEAWTLRAMRRRASGWQPPAIADATMALRLDPKNARAWSTRAQSHYVQGLWTQAVNDATAALDLDPANFDARLYRGMTYLRIDDNSSAGKARALQDFERLTQVNPQNPRGWLMKAQVLYDLQRFDECAATLAKVRQLVPFGLRQLGGPIEDIWSMELDARGHLIQEGQNLKPAEMLMRARVLADTRAGAPKAEALRQAVDLLLRANVAQAQERQAPWGTLHLGVAAARRIGRALLDAGYLEEAGRILGLLDTWKWDDLGRCDDYYLHARIHARLALQLKSGRVRMLGANDKESADLEAMYAAMETSQRESAASRERTLALECLKRAAELGFSDAKQLLEEADFVALHGDPAWQGTVARVNEAAKSPEVARRLAAITPPTLVSIIEVIKGGQGQARGFAAGDVILSIGDKLVTDIDSLRAALSSIGEPSVARVRRFTRDGQGALILLRGADGSLQLDPLGRPQYQFTDTNITVTPGALGVGVDEGELPSVRPIP